MNKRISIVIPNYNGSKTIGKCLEAVFSSVYDNFEVVVVDDCSSDNSADIINLFPCKFIKLSEHSGASRARNSGAKNSTGEILFFIDADCVISEDALFVINKSFVKKERIVIGGSYTPRAYDDTFFSNFQSVFVNYSETKKKIPDYIATHAMVIEKRLFEESGGFREDFMPILEDVEFSHRIKKAGIRLEMNPDLFVRHIFNYSFFKSMKNAYRKTKYWVMYSLQNRDIFSDSGTASIELKVNVVSFFTILFFVSIFLITGFKPLLTVTGVVLFLNLFINRGLLRAFYKAKGIYFAMAATFYYSHIYPIAIGTGTFVGMMNYFFKVILKKQDLITDY